MTEAIVTTITFLDMIGAEAKNNLTTRAKGYNVSTGSSFAHGAPEDARELIDLAAWNVFYNIFSKQVTTRKHIPLINEAFSGSFDPTYWLNSKYVLEYEAKIVPNGDNVWAAVYLTVLKPKRGQS